MPSIYLQHNVIFFTGNKDICVLYKDVQRFFCLLVCFQDWLQRARLSFLLFLMFVDGGSILFGPRRDTEKQTLQKISVGLKLSLIKNPDAYLLFP